MGGTNRLEDDFSPAGMTGMSRRTVEKFAKRVAQLDEQGADAVGIGQYVRRSLRWTTAGLEGCLRWTETERPWGIESVSGRLVHGLLALRVFPIQYKLDARGEWIRTRVVSILHGLPPRG
jgi:hypothetical protein